jgi:hypothetical protein
MGMEIGYDHVGPQLLHSLQQRSSVVYYSNQVAGILEQNTEPLGNYRMIIR